MGLIFLILLQLKREYDEAIAAGDKVKAAQVDEKIKARIAVLMHVYHTVAVHFADLHDTPERMLEKECISEIVPWRESRRWLYWRLRRLLLEDAYIKKILRAQDNLSVGQAKQMLRRWLVEDKGATEVSMAGFPSHSEIFLIQFNFIFQAYLWDKNEEMVSWYKEQTNGESIVSRNVNSVRRDAVISTISKMLEVLEPIFFS